MGFSGLEFSGGKTVIMHRPEQDVPAGFPPARIAMWSTEGYWFHVISCRAFALAPNPLGDPTPCNGFKVQSWKS